MAVEQEKIFNKNSIKGIRQHLRNNTTYSESRLWTKLRGRQLCGLKFRRQHGIDRYIVDFYCPELRVAIEIDGDSHYDEHGFVVEKQRENLIESLGITLLRFTNIEVNQNINGVLDKIVESGINHPQPLLEKEGGN